jgi:hypothetical protein
MPPPGQQKPAQPGQPQPGQNPPPGQPQPKQDDEEPKAKYAVIDTHEMYHREVCALDEEGDAKEAADKMNEAEKKAKQDEPPRFVTMKVTDVASQGGAVNRVDPKNAAPKKLMPEYLQAQQLYDTASMYAELTKAKLEGADQKRAAAQAAQAHSAHHPG